MRRLLMPALTALLLLATPAFGQVGSIVCPLGVNWCPAGDIPFPVSNWLQDGSPVVNGLIYVIREDLGPNFTLCSNDSSNFSVRTDETGAAVLRIRAGGVDPYHGARIYLQRPESGTVVSFRHFTGAGSVDQNGDMVVDSVDRDILVSRIGTSPFEIGDFDLDYDITMADVAFLEQHLGHTCPFTKARPSTWGALKLIYR